LFEFGYNFLRTMIRGMIWILKYVDWNFILKFFSVFNLFVFLMVKLPNLIYKGRILKIELNIIKYLSMYFMEEKMKMCNMKCIWRDKEELF